uniref:Small ribosomal subunit protein uS15c n=1 Tax=Haplomitrium blumei TaxID=258993 RepID=A0A4Y5P7Y4_9MARC|nr:ribosomal protein S15 [Haplomitrium blumei]QCW59385.1 ribosomal protein S15 [Haplomitrium blumei]
MYKNISIQPPPACNKREGSVESQILNLTNRVTRLTFHFKRHDKDYSSRRGLWKILGKRKRLLAHLFETNRLTYEELTSRSGIRGFKNR